MKPAPLRLTRSRDGWGFTRDTLRKKRQDEGFTLLEIVIALGLIAIALLAVFHLQAQNLDIQSEAQFMTIAKCLIQDRISQIECRDTLSEGKSSGEVGEDCAFLTGHVHRIAGHKRCSRIFSVLHGLAVIHMLKL